MDKKGLSNITQKLHYIQQNLKAPKGQYNSFGDYHYRSCEDIQEALKPLLKDVGAVLLLTDEIVQIGDRFYIKAAAILQDIESTEKIVNTSYARECDSKPKMDSAQITGSCSSYARKYALNGLFCIDDSKDPDTMNNSDCGKSTTCSSRKETKSQNNKSNNISGYAFINQDHVNMIRSEIERTGALERAVCYQYNIKSLYEMTMQQFESAISIFEQMPDKK